MINFREIRKEDNTQLIKLFEFLSDDPTEFDIGLVINDVNCHTVVVDDCGQVIGFGCLIIHLVPTKGYVGRLEDIVIHGKRQGEGLGGKLMDELIKKATEMGIAVVDLTSNPGRLKGRRLYEKKGFKLRDTGVFRLKLEEHECI